MRACAGCCCAGCEPTPLASLRRLLLRQGHPCARSPRAGLRRLRVCARGILRSFAVGALAPVAASPGTSFARSPRASLRPWRPCAGCCFARGIPALVRRGRACAGCGSAPGASFARSPRAGLRRLPLRREHPSLVRCGRVAAAPLRLCRDLSRPSVTPP